MMYVTSPIEQRVSGALSAEKLRSLPREMLDVLRVLIVYGGASWKSELARELPLFRAFEGGPAPVNEMKLDEALRRLEKEGLVKVEKRVRADMGAQGSEEDELVTIVDISATRNALAKNRVLTSYIRGK